MKSCCSAHIESERQRKSLFQRNIFVALLALLMHIHTVEHYLFQPQYALHTTIACSYMLFSVITQDFHHVKLPVWLDFTQFFKLLALGVFMLFFGVPILTSLLLLLGVCLLPTLSRLMRNAFPRSVKTSMTTENITKSFFERAWDRVLKEIEVMTGFFDFSLGGGATFLPSMDVIVLLSSVLHYVLSLFVIYHPSLLSCEIMLNDAMLTVAVYNLGRWLKSYWESPRLDHNHDTKVTIIKKSYHGELTRHEIKISQIGEGDIIYVNPVKYPEGVMLPVGLCDSRGDDLKKFVGANNAPVDYVYQDCQGEKRENLAHGVRKDLDANTTVYSGFWQARATYKPRSQQDNCVMLREQRGQNDDLYTRLWIFTLYILAFTVSMKSMYISGYIIGIKTLCMALMVACPCVYFIVRPSLQNKIHQYLRYAKTSVDESVSGYIMMCCQTLPGFNFKKKIVFDRTNTTFIPDAKNPDGAYVISEGNKNAIQTLVNDGYEVYVLSGHSTNNWHKHLEETRTLFKRLGVPGDNVLFDKIYHGQGSRKGDVIHNLKYYNLFHHERPKSFFIRIYSRLMSFLNPSTLIMVGDDINDRDAMVKADLAISVGAVIQNYGISVNDDVMSTSHFIMSKGGMEYLPGLLKVIGRVSLSINVITAFSALTAVFTLLGIAGYSVHMGMYPLRIAPSLVCTFSTAYCFAVTALVNSSLLDPLLGTGRMFTFQDLWTRARSYFMKNMTSMSLSDCALWLIRAPENLAKSFANVLAIPSLSSCSAKNLHCSQNNSLNCEAFGLAEQSSNQHQRCSSHSLNEISNGSPASKGHSRCVNGCSHNHRKEGPSPSSSATDFLEMQYCGNCTVHRL